MPLLRSNAPKLLLLLAMTGLLASCQLFEKEIPARKVRIESLTVKGTYPEGSDRFEAWAMIRGYQAGADARLLPPRQWQDGYRVHLEQLERPASEEAMADSPTPFTRALPIDTSDLRPGFYIVNVNGLESRLEIPEPPEPEEQPVDGETPAAPTAGAPAS